LPEYIIVSISYALNMSIFMKIVVKIMVDFILQKKFFL